MRVRFNDCVWKPLRKDLEGLRVLSGLCHCTALRDLLREKGEMLKGKVTGLTAVGSQVSAELFVSGERPRPSLQRALCPGPALLWPLSCTSPFL